MTSPEVVSIVIPCYNEERFIAKALQQLVDQYDKERYEIVVVDGFSTDKTRTLIEEFQRDHPDVEIRVIDNPARNIPKALNLGIAAARGTIIARMDAHAAPSPGYVQGCAEALRDTDAAVVGMPCRIQPGADTLTARAIAAAVAHPFGVGDAKYRLGLAGPLRESVDTVAFACFRKNLWRDLNGFNEALLTNEDYEFNFRVRQSGGKVILDRSGYCDYFARSTLRGLVEQYVRYGFWKAEMIRFNPGSIRMRHLVAPGFLLSLLTLAVAGLIWRSAWWALLIEGIVYLLSCFVAALHAAVRARANIRIIPLMPFVFATIHFSWGGSFLLRMLGIRTVASK